MYLEIVTPEQVLLESEVNSVSVPGVEGEFQILDHHASIVSVLEKGKLKIGGSFQIDEDVRDKFSKDGNGHTILLIEGGILEMKDNKAVVLAD